MPIEWDPKDRGITLEMEGISLKKDTLYVDIHEPPTVHQILQDKNIPFIVRSLQPLGDFVYNNASCERKTIFDLAASTLSDRISKQFEKVPLGCYKMLMIVYPLQMLKDDFHTKNLNEDFLFGSIASLAVRYNARILWGHNEKETIPVMVKILKKFSEGKADIPRQHTIERSTHSRTGDTIRSFLRVDPSIANALVSNAKKSNKGILKYIMEAKDSELMLISGMGPVTIKRIRELIG
jgi:ERCC4-type nuclease